MTNSKKKNHQRTPLEKCAVKKKIFLIVAHVNEY